MNPIGELGRSEFDIVIVRDYSGNISRFKRAELLFGERYRRILEFTFRFTPARLLHPIRNFAFRRTIEPGFFYFKAIATEWGLNIARRVIVRSVSLIPDISIGIG